MRKAPAAAQGDVHGDAAGLQKLRPLVVSLLRRAEEQARRRQRVDVGAGGRDEL